MTCCEHSVQEHATIRICDDAIHYPSEDYPCLCEQLVTEPGRQTCAACNHPASMHTVRRACRPGSGAPCACEVRLSSSAG